MQYQYLFYRKSLSRLRLIQDIFWAKDGKLPLCFSGLLGRVGHSDAINKLLIFQANNPGLHFQTAELLDAFAQKNVRTTVATRPNHAPFPWACNFLQLKGLPLAFGNSNETSFFRLRVRRHHLVAAWQGHQTCPAHQEAAVPVTIEAFCA